jgi:hypothetical protein
MDNVEYGTISKIFNETKLSRMTYMHKVKCNTFLAEVSTDVFLILQQESFFYSHQGIDVN